MPDIRARLRSVARPCAVGPAGRSVGGSPRAACYPDACRLPDLLLCGGRRSGGIGDEQYFDVGDETLWNPSNGAGRLFMRQVEVFEAELKLPSGIGQGRYWGDPDTFEVDPAVYAVFVRGLVAWYCWTGHSVIRALSEGFTATAVTLARRAGIDVEVPEPAPDHRCGDPQRDIQVSGNPGTASHDKVEALGIRAREMDRWMAR
ncbi:DUF6086 family protein [Streptomyces sp. NPDC093676]|uniref:DUF6086 family protein n=1 Tax=Streptomyces sp. NPDC093676 TaxID=3366050 RepID=UPI003812E6CA